MDRYGIVQTLYTSQWTWRLPHWIFVFALIHYLTCGLSTTGKAAGLLFLAYYVYMTWHYHVFSSQGIPGPTPIFPIGSLLPFLWKGLQEAEVQQARHYGKVYGTSIGRYPMLVVSDLDMVHEIMTTRFTDFTNRPTRFARDEISSQLQSFARDDNWRQIRHQLSPVFGPSRCKKMTSTVNSCARDLVQNIEQASTSGTAVNFIDLMGLYSLDVIMSTCFGVRGNIQANNEYKYLQMGRRIMNFSVTNPALLCAVFLPPLLPWISSLGGSFFPREVTDFFMGVVRHVTCLHTSSPERSSFHSDVVEDRRSRSSHNDRIGRGGIPLEQLQAQGLQLFIGGYDSTSKSISFIFYNLATNPHCQELVYQEIMEYLPYPEEPLVYSQINKLEYLHMCVLESLRMYSPATRLEREARRDVTVHGIRIPAGCSIGIPSIAIHHDPDIYPQPDVFMPGRFSPDARAKRHPMAFLPFGAGPRNCPGMQLGMLEAKVAVIHVIRHFRLLTCDKTDIPMKFKRMAMIVPENGIWLKAERRTDN